MEGGSIVLEEGGQASKWAEEEGSRALWRGGRADKWAEEGAPEKEAVGLVGGHRQLFFFKLYLF